MMTLDQLPSGARTPQSQRTYRSDLAAFERYCGGLGLDSSLLLSAQPVASELLHNYQAHLISDGKLSPASINRRLDCLRGALRSAREVGLIGWRVELRPVPTVPYRDTSGPGPAGAAALLCLLDTSAIDCRDRLALRLSWDLALRRGEVVGLDLGDVLGAPDGEGDRLDVRAKGGARHTLTLPGPTRAALLAWLRHRGTEPGPLVCACHDAAHVSRPLRRLDAGQWWRRLRALGLRAGLHELHPHALRHGSITAALDAGADPRAVQRFSRHRKLDTLIRYDDNRTDMGGQIAAVVATLPLLAGRPAPPLALPPGDPT